METWATGRPKIKKEKAEKGIDGWQMIVTNYCFFTFA